MTTFERNTQILKDFIKGSTESLESGNSVCIRGGYINHSYEENIIDSNCSKIVEKLVSLGYEYTTNHGHGCRDYHFTKKIEL